MTPSWYDLLDVDRAASNEEIRGAWRAAVADLDPTDRRFAVLNRAAKVLLDPARRAAYDEELDREAELDEDTDDTDAQDGGDEREPAAPVVLTKPAPAGSDDTAEVVDDPEAEPAGPAASVATGPSATDGSSQRASLLITVLAGVATVAFVVIAVLAATQSRDESAAEDGIADARTAAEQAVVPVLSYDATDLEAGRSSATSFLTDDFREEYDELFDGLIESNAEQIGARVQTVFVSSAVVRTDPDEDRVQVLVFFDQATTNDTTPQPRVANNQATFTMELVGDRWLVDDIETGFGG